MGLYSATKHAIEGLSETLDHEVRDFVVRVVLVEPSYTKTNLDLNAPQAASRISDTTPIGPSCQRPSCDGSRRLWGQTPSPPPSAPLRSATGRCVEHRRARLPF
jgi:NAD(P)-dependent dehydrogenase (short-subunit alcohol dehydrogenase family)